MLLNIFNLKQIFLGWKNDSKSAASWYKNKQIKRLGTVVGRINAYKRRKILTNSIFLVTILVLSYFLVES